MNSIETLLDQPIFQALGWTLLHFIWQGALIAVLYLSLSLLLRRFAANVRYAAACGTLLLMLIAPGVTMLMMLSVDSGSNTAAPAVFGSEWAQGAQMVDAAIKSSVDQMPSATESEIESSPSSQPNSMKHWAQEHLPRIIPWLLALWLAGVFFLSLRFAGGLVMVQRLKRTETSATIQHWQEKLSWLSHRLRVSRPVRLCESALVEVPTVIGWLRPVILLPASALTGLSAAQWEALLAHELAHIRRYDYLVNLMQTGIETLFFYHPAVWWVSSQARQEREHCCDDAAVAACGDVLTYARALAALERLRSSQVQLAVAANGGSLLVRIQRLLPGRSPAHYGIESGLAGFIALAAILILLGGAQAALLSRSAKTAAIKEAFAVMIPDSAPRVSNQSAISFPPTRVDRSFADQGATHPPDANSPKANSNEEPDGVGEVATAVSDPPPQEVTNDESHNFISAMTAAGLTDVKDEHVALLRRKGITPEFVQEMSSLVSSKLTVDRIVAMRVHGVSSAFAAELKSQGFASLSADELIAFRIHGVTSEFVNELRSAGYQGLSAEALVAFRIHGVTAAFIRQLSDIGFANLSGQQLNAFAIHGVTPVFIQTMSSFIHGNLTAEDVLGLRIHGVTSELIKELEIMGYANLTAQQLMEIRIHGVTPGFIRGMQSAGYDRLTIQQLGELRISGVTPEFIQTIKSRGFTDATPHQLAVMRRLNILPSAPK
jgi:beta-lactamase regulating signal transducer with metallopeptidase domain